MIAGVTLLFVLKELEKKVSQTAPFQNLKQMLQKKNDQIKDLRRRLSKYVSKPLDYSLSFCIYFCNEFVLIFNTVHLN